MAGTHGQPEIVVDLQRAGQRGQRYSNGGHPGDNAHGSGGSWPMPHCLREALERLAFFLAAIFVIRTEFKGIGKCPVELIASSSYLIGQLVLRAT